MATSIKPGPQGEFEQRLQGARLLTAEVLYYMPDHPKLLQTYLWQTLDVAPKFPRLHEFLEHWRREIEAVIHSVRVAHGEPLDAPQWRNASGLFRMH
ncbi:MAG: aspartate-semialdehyde dehydrogenase [Hyphomonadaceae bacterium]|nr:aspartate-semialdehyde dehydrogenase [Hyphomonadaceae bacterium]